MSKKLGVIIGLGAVALAVAAAIATVLLGYVYIGVKQPEQTTTLRYVVCGDSEVNSFNEKMTSTDSLQSLISEVEKKSHYQDDPTCLVMAYYYYASGNTGSDNGKVDDLYNRIRDLANSGSYASSKLSVSSSLTQLDYLKGGTATTGRE